jgi:hypothetical protein
MVIHDYSRYLRAGRSGDRIPVGARLFAHVQTGPGAQPVFCKMGTGSFPGVKRPGRGADHPLPTGAEVIPLLPLWASGPVITDPIGRTVITDPIGRTVSQPIYEIYTQQIHTQQIYTQQIHTQQIYTQ